MKTKLKNMYEIRCHTSDSIYSKLMSYKLREYKAAVKLVKKLKSMGHDAFHTKIVIRIIV